MVYNSRRRFSVARITGAPCTFPAVVLLYKGKETAKFTWEAGPTKEYETEQKANMAAVRKVVAMRKGK